MNIKTNLKRLLKDMSKYKIWMVLAFICAIVTSLSSVLSTYLLGLVIDYIPGKNSVDFPTVYQFIFFLAVVFITYSLFQWLLAILANKIAFNTVKDMRQTAFKRLTNLPLSFFDNHPHGDIISRFTNDLDSVGDALTLTINNLFSGIVIVITALVFMLYLSFKVTLVVLCVTPICFIIAYYITKFSQKTFQKQQDTVGDISSYVSEIVGNQKVVKAFGYEKESIDQFQELNQSLFETGKNAQFAAALVNPSTRFVDHLSYASVGIVAAFFALSEGLAIGTISSFLIYSSQFAKPFNEISGIMAQIQTAFASLQRIYAIIDEKPEKADKVPAKILKNVEGKVDFSHVDFSYNKNKKLLENLTFSAKPGDLIAIVGPTGAGKTTIVNLLMRFYEIDKGTISIDNDNVENYTKNSVRLNFGMVLQETWLFNDTIKENIAYGKPDATEEEIKQAAKSAHAHSFIKRLSDQYDTIISENGDNLSQGQKQLLTIARAMLADPPMLILDEATSSIDTLTEIRIQKAFLKLMKGRTSFIIAHRLSTITAADLILVLDKGNIVETGTHTELLAKGGFYSNLYNSQFA